MLRPLHPVLFLLTSLLVGCQAVDPMALFSGHLPGQSSEKTHLTQKFNGNDPAEKQKALASIDHKLIGQMIAEAAPGSQVAVVAEFDRQYSGTLLKGKADGLELMNCVSKEAVPGPEGHKQCKISHVPFQSFKTATITRFMVISQPPPGFIPPDIRKDPGTVTVAEIVYKDGHHQRLAAPTNKTKPPEGGLLPEPAPPPSAQSRLKSRVHD